MINPALITVPLLTAFTGWLVVWLIGKLLFSPVTPKKIAGLTIQGILPSLQPIIAEKAGQMAKAQFSLSEIEQKITSPETVQQIMPLVEGHIDFFLREKLKEKMPMISMFIGEKTIAELKEVFLAEIAAMFPELIKGYLNNLQKDLDIQQTVSAKINEIPSTQLKSIIMTDSLQKQLNKAALSGGFIGLIIGLIQLAILLIA